MVRTRSAALNGAVPDNLPVISRPRAGAMVGGVCAGLARRWRVDPNLLRIAVVVLAFFGGVGLIAYACGMLLMPREDQVQPLIHRVLPFTRTWPTGAVIALTVAVAVVLIALGGFHGIGFGPLVAIFCIWFFGFRGRNSRAPAAPPVEPTPFERAADNWRQRLVEQQTPGYVDQQTPVRPDVPNIAPEQPRWTQPYTDPATDLAVRDDDLPAPVRFTTRRPRRWRLWWLALTLVGVAVLTVTVLGLVSLPATPLAYAAAVLAGLGLTLLASTRRGRPPLLLPATLITAIITGSLLMGAHGMTVPTVGEWHRAYSSGAELPPQLTLSAGELTVDLSSLELTGDQTIDVHVGTGQLNLILPAGTAAEVDWTVKSGEFKETGVGTRDSRDGFDLKGSGLYGPQATGTPTLHINASVDLGELDVKR